MNSFFSEHKFIFISGIFLAIFIMSSSWLFPLMAGDYYRGINLGEWVDDAHYIVKGREILEGHSLGNIFLKIGKNNSSDPHQVYVEYLLLSPIRALGLSNFAKNHVVAIYGFYDFLGIVGLVLLIYFLILYFSENKLLSVATAIFAVGGQSLVKLSRISAISTSPDLNIFSRPVIPLFGVIALFIYINILARTIKQTRWRHILWAGISFGAIFYVYPYAWTFAFAMTGALFLLYAFLREWDASKKILKIFFIGVVIGSYTIFKTLTFQNSEIGRQILYYGTTLGHNPAPFSKILFLVLILSLVFLYCNKSAKGAPIFFSMVVANWIVLNQQIITGRVPQVMHYFWYFTIPTSIVVGAYLAWELLWGWERSKIILQKYGNALLCLLIIAAFANTARQQYMGMLATWEIKEYAQNYRPIIDALNRDPKPGVILTSEPFYGRFVLVYTDHDLFWGHATSLVYNTPMKRIKDALYVYMYLDKDVRNNFAAALREVDTGYAVSGLEAKNSFYPLIYFYLAGFNSGFDYDEYTLRVLSGDPIAVQSREKTISALSGEYKKITNGKNGIADILKKTEVNYIIWDKNKNPEWDLSPVPGLKKITESNNIYLYSVALPSHS